MEPVGGSFTPPIHPPRQVGTQGGCGVYSQTLYATNLATTGRNWRTISKGLSLPTAIAALPISERQKREGRGEGLVRPVRLFGLLQLNLETFRPHLKPVHGLDGTLGGYRVVKRDKPETFAEIGDFVDEDLGADDGAKGGKHLHKVRVRHIVREVVDEEVAAIGTCGGGAEVKGQQTQHTTHIPSFCLLYDGRDILGLDHR